MFKLYVFFTFFQSQKSYFWEKFYFKRDFPAFKSILMVDVFLCKYLRLVTFRQAWKVKMTFERELNKKYPSFIFIKMSLKLDEENENQKKMLVLSLRQ